MRLYTTSSSFTRPNDIIAYTAGDLVANDTVAANVVPMVFTPPQGFLLTSVKLKITGNTVNTNALFTVHLYQFNPLLTNGDNGVFATTTESGYLGNVYVDCTLLPIAGTDVIGQGPVDPNLVPIFLDPTQGAGGPLNQIYGLIRAESAYIPTALEVFTVTLIGVD